MDCSPLGIPATGMPSEPKGLGTIIPHMPGPVNGYEEEARESVGSTLAWLVSLRYSALPVE